MAKDRPKSIQAEMAKAARELEKEEKKTQNTEGRTLDEVAKKLLLLERDLSLPGSGVSESARVKRIIEILEGERF